jgi:hypothetical protein
MPSLDRPPRVEAPAEPPPEEAHGEQIVDLPAREALTIVDPAVFGLGIPSPLARTAAQPPATPDAPEAPVPET